MRFLVDSSVWIDYFNDRPAPETDRLDLLLARRRAVATCGPVVTEVLQGARRTEQRFRMVGYFRKVEFLEANGIDLFLRAAEVYRQLRERGMTVRSTIDCLLAVLAERYECQILARDRDIEAIVTSGLVRTSLLR